MDCGTNLNALYVRDVEDSFPLERNSGARPEHNPNALSRKRGNGAVEGINMM
jgi:hypothetical protein